MSSAAAATVKKPAYVLATSDQLAPLLAAGWTQNVDERETLSKTYKFKGFKPAWRFMNAVAESANSLNHRKALSASRHILLSHVSRPACSC